MNIELAIEKIKILLKVDGIDFQDKEKALKSISETCLPTKLSKIYMEHIYENINS
ncbi:hypothetical protein [Providencia rettgeri]|uniref:hypothetical protein n=1 Tax=Providencia rettgeri TaxID=587 RepID=UPI00301AF725